MTIDKDLIVQLVQKDHEAYNTFYLQTVDMFYRFVLSRYILSSQEIEDVISDFYMKFWQVVDRYNDAYAFETYMRTVFRNVIKDYFKRKKLYTLPETFDVHDPNENDKTLLSSLENDYLLEDIKRSMRELDAVSYDIIFLKFIEEKTYEEISFLLGLSQEAVRQRISRSLKKLKTSLERKIKN